MLGRTFRGLFAAGSMAALLCLAPPAGGGIRDDTAWLQAKLDAGGEIFLPRLAGGRCYATRGLWVSRDDTAIGSDGACLVALGPGEGRIRRADGSLVRANAVFFVDHSDVRRPLPVRIAISGVHISVPRATHMHGISVLGNEVSLTSLKIDGAPLTDITIGSGTVGSGGLSGRIELTRPSPLRRTARRRLRLRSRRTSCRAKRHLGRRLANGGRIAHPRGRPRPADTRRHGHRQHVQGQRGPWSLARPCSSKRPADSRNGYRGHRKRPARQCAQGGAGSSRAIVVLGGQSDGKGVITVSGNEFHANRGPGLLRRKGIPAVAKVAPRTVPPVVASGAERDDTTWLQSRLDRAGGTVFLPALPNGECYATRGLWVSRDRTTITSDGACIVSLGLGPVRLHSIDGDPIAASAVFFVNRSRPTRPAPADVTISNLRIVVPPGQSMYGVAIFGHRVTLSRLDIDGSPKDDVTISGRGNGNSFAGSISILGLDPQRGDPKRYLRHRRDRAAHRAQHDHRRPRFAAGTTGRGHRSGAGRRGQPALDVHIVGNTIRDNAGPGILLELESNDGQAVVATALEIRGNTIVRNSSSERRRSGRESFSPAVRTGPRNARSEGQRHSRERRARHPAEPPHAARRRRGQRHRGNEVP